MGSEELLNILDSVQIKKEPQEGVFCEDEDPLAVDMSPLVKMEISDNPLILKEENVLSHVDPVPDIGTETIGNSPPSFFQLQSLFPCKKVNLHPPAASLKIKSVRSSLPLVLPSASSSSSQKRTTEEDYDKCRKLKKVKLERERRVALKELFEDLDYWVTLGLDERSRR